uniref:MerR family transcriptional regulator n=1 Tax=candidate division CPR3 bacterium TaxID=2268181 RepID=A0A7V3J9U8_UNCC3
MIELFNMTEVIEAVNEGITRNHIYYMERLKLVKPKKKRCGHSIQRVHRFFTQEDVELIKLLWKYRKAGYEWSKAEELAKKDFEQRTLF